MNPVKIPKMNNLFLFLLKSTLCLSILYLAFSMMMRQETFFRLNRMLLLLMVLSSAIIPFLTSPQAIQPFKKVRLEPIFRSKAIIQEPVQSNDFQAAIQLSAPVSNTIRQVTIPIKNLLGYIYLTGIIISILILLYSIVSVLLLFRKASKSTLNGFHLRVVDDDIPAFSFGHNILISQQDYDLHYDAIITHEQSHIRLGHFYDLILMEITKIIFWFNPLVYSMFRDLKAIHEFQADDYTLTSGIDATKYQLLIIQKCVGYQKFALANSFNHCQIKNRITMMNKQKTSKAGLWKVAIFFPLLALLLMAFGKMGENVNPKSKSNNPNSLDTLIYGKRLIIKDTTQYSASFIKGLKEQYKGYEELRLKDDSLIIIYQMNNSRRDTIVLNKFTIPTNLELNKEVVFSKREKDKSFTMVLKRTNYTNMEYQLKKEGKTIKSGIAQLGDSFYFGAEIDIDEKGTEIHSRQYIDIDNTIIKIEIEQGKIASITYCVDQNEQKFETLTFFLRK